MCRKLKIEKYAWKIIAITTIAILVSTITLYSGETLRCPLSSQVTEVIQETAEIELSRQLASDNKKIRDVALGILAKIDNPVQIHRIVERTFDNRNIKPKFEGQTWYAVHLIDTTTADENDVGFIIFGKMSANRFDINPIEIKEALQKKHLLTLLFKWMATDSKLIEKFSGEKLIIRETNFKVARAMWRSGFYDIKIEEVQNGEVQNIDDIKEGKYYTINCRFPFMKELIERQTVITPVLASVIFSRSKI